MVAAFDRPHPSPAGTAHDDGHGVTIAVDAMGGDHGPSEIVPGALDHAAAHPQDRILLVGDAATLREIAGPLPANVEIVHASEVVGMDEHPAMALREKKDSTILIATDLVKHGTADAVVTAGHTGAGMAAAVLRLGRLPGVDRPALAVQLITDGGTLVLLDIGANPDSSPENLAQYARMGSIFSQKVLGVATPRVALLSIGEEKGKGDLRIQQATELLDQTDLHFVGNVEGKDLTRHEADVVVCDAVLGNVVIKFFEGLSTLHLRPVPDRVLALAPGQDRVRPDAARHHPDPLGVRLRAGRWVAAAGREGHGDHHPRPGEAADDRLRRRGRGDDGPDPGPGADRRGASAERDRRGRCPGCPHRAGDAGRRAAGPGARLVSGPELTIGRGVIAEMVRMAAIANPGVARVSRGGPAWRAALAGPSVVSHVADSGVRIRVWIVARPGQQLTTLADDVRTAVGAAVERLLGMRLESVTVTVDGVGS